MYFIKSGTVGVMYIEENGVEHIIHKYKEGDYFGDLNIDQEKRESLYTYKLLT